MTDDLIELWNDLGHVASAFTGDCLVCFVKQKQFVDGKREVCIAPPEEAEGEE